MEEVHGPEQSWNSAFPLPTKSLKDQNNLGVIQGLNQVSLTVQLILSSVDGLELLLYQDSLLLQLMPSFMCLPIPRQDGWFRSRGLLKASLGNLGSLKLD